MSTGVKSMVMLCSAPSASYTVTPVEKTSASLADVVAGLSTAAAELRFMLTWK